MKNWKSEKRRNRVLTNTVCHLSQVIGDMEQRLHNLELNSMKKSLVLTGFLPNKSRKSDVIQELVLFFQAEFAAKVEIEDFFYLNANENAPMVITFEKPKHKAAIFQNITNIQDLENENGQPYYINDHLPPNLIERKQKEREKYGRAREQEILEQEKIDWHKGRMLINGQPYQEKLLVPNERDILKLSTSEFDKIMQVKLQKGNRIECKDSKFIAYTLYPTSLQQVQEAYMKVKILHGSSRHIICGYSIPSLLWVEATGACDDDEIKAGRSLLKWMMENSLSHRALFVVRYCGFPKLGPERFTCYMKSAKSAIDAMPTNSLTLEKQTCTVQQYVERKKRERKQYTPRESLSNLRRRGIRGSRQPVRCMRRGMHNRRSTTYAETLTDTNYGSSFSFSNPHSALDKDEWPRLNNLTYEKQKYGPKPVMKQNASI